MNRKEKSASKDLQNICKKPRDTRMAEWSPSEFTGWTRNLLFEKKIDAKDIELFLNELIEKAISGKVFIEIMEKNKKFEELQKQFSTDIQKKYGIWQAIETKFHEKFRLYNTTYGGGLLPQLRQNISAVVPCGSYAATYSDVPTDSEYRMPEIVEDSRSTIARNDSLLVHSETRTTCTYYQPYSDVQVSFDNL